jgi:hypothetical protein
MTSFNASTGTIQASSLEGAALIAAQLLQDLEDTITDSPNNIAVNYFTGDSVVQIQWQTPINTSMSSAGALVITGDDYVTYPSFAAGGDVKSTQLAPALLEIFQKLQALEKAQEDSNDPEAKNKIQISYDIDALTGTVNAELPIDFTAAAGVVEISAVSYLA